MARQINNTSFKGFWSLTVFWKKHCSLKEARKKDTSWTGREIYKQSIMINHARGRVIYLLFPSIENTTKSLSWEAVIKQILSTRASLAWLNITSESISYFSARAVMQIEWYMDSCRWCKKLMETITNTLRSLCMMNLTHSFAAYRC